MTFPVSQRVFVSSLSSRLGVGSPGGMVVDRQDGSRMVEQRRCKSFPGMDHGSIEGALRNRLDAGHLSLAVQQHHQEMFMVFVPEPGHHQHGPVFRAMDGLERLAFCFRQPSPQFQSCQDHRCLGRPDSWNPGQFPDILGPGQTGILHKISGQFPSDIQG